MSFICKGQAASRTDKVRSREIGDRGKVWFNGCCWSASEAQRGREVRASCLSSRLKHTRTNTHTDLCQCDAENGGRRQPRGAASDPAEQACCRDGSSTGTTCLWGCEGRAEHGRLTAALISKSQICRVSDGSSHWTGCRSDPAWLKGNEKKWIQSFKL